MPDFLLDTNVVIDHLRGEPGVIDFLLLMREKGQLACSILTQTEVFAGMREEEAQVTKLFFRAVDLLDVTSAIAEHGGDYRRTWFASHGTSLIDGLIAATCRLHGHVLVTGDITHFPMPEIPLIRPQLGKRPAEVIRGDKGWLGEN